MNVYKKKQKAWKIAKATMIPKKVSDSDNSTDNIPINVTSCLGKLFEKLVTYRLYSFDEREKLLSTC